MAVVQRPALKQSPAWRGHFRSQFKKTKMCRYYPLGQCKFGSECCFAHAADELSPAPDLTKTSFCAGFMGGYCRLPAGQCQYAHGEDDLRVSPEFAAKKLSRRTRDAAVASETSTSQDGDLDGETEFEWAGLESCLVSDTEWATDAPSSPLHWASSGTSTPASATQAPGSVALPALAKGVASKRTVCLDDVAGGPVRQKWPSLLESSRVSLAPNGGTWPPTMSQPFNRPSERPAPVAWPRSGSDLALPPPHTSPGIYAWADSGRPVAVLEPVRVVFAESVGLGIPTSSLSTLPVDPILLEARRSHLPLRVEI
mmetsp:Transcript_96702/g.270668  ORF Transcript_96702/g.270668 Transcript_96702/m.270668 type:complete len:312 (+) Transcript_96702:100-1035(+)